jgi:hypothetical protein
MGEVFLAQHAEIETQVASSASSTKRSLGVAIDATGRLYAANFWDHTIAIFAAGQSGGAPVAGISGASTGLVRPSLITF